MGNKVRGIIAMAVGVFALWHSYTETRTQPADWRVWLEVAAGLLLILLGLRRVMRKAEDPAAEILK